MSNFCEGLNKLRVYKVINYININIHLLVVTDQLNFIQKYLIFIYFFKYNHILYLELTSTSTKDYLNKNRQI